VSDPRFAIDMATMCNGSSGEVCSTYSVPTSSRISIKPDHRIAGGGPGTGIGVSCGHADHMDDAIVTAVSQIRTSSRSQVTPSTCCSWYAWMMYG